MALNELTSANRYNPLVQQKFPTSNVDKTENSFADTLKSFVGEVDEQQKETKQLTESFIKGDNVDMHDVMIASQKSKTSFQLLMELRTKGLDLYREVLRMQV
jgi:flagellar hook-basal body complex protein FliE